MKRHVESWKIADIAKKRAQISFPEYQRQPSLWSQEKKALLIDSILNDFDIPKLYFNKTNDGTYEVVDGQQRLWAIWDFISGDLEVTQGKKRLRFLELSAADRKRIENYELQVTVMEDAGDKYLRELFVRLQLGLLLVAGEKLNAATGAAKDLVFDDLAKHAWVKHSKVSARRFGKETLCAQIAINVFSVEKTQSFSSTRYEDLEYFFAEYAKPIGKDRELFVTCSKQMRTVMDQLAIGFGEKVGKLGNRSYLLSIFMLADHLARTAKLKDQIADVADFSLHFWTRLRQEIEAGIGRRNELLFNFESWLSSAPGEKYQIKRRHNALIESFNQFLDDGKLPGD